MQFLFSFKGRIGRQQYLLGSLGVAVITVVILGILGGIIGSMTATAKQAGLPVDQAIKASPAMLALMALFGLSTLPFLWAGWALGAKRCHDHGRSGWFMLLGIVPAANVWLMIENIFVRGEDRSNVYGPPAVPQQPTA